MDSRLRGSDGLEGSNDIDGNARLPASTPAWQGIGTVPGPLLSSFSEVALAAAQQEAPELARALLFDSVPPDWLARLQTLGAVALHTNHKHLTPAMAAAIKAAGYGLFCYTVNDPQRARIIRAWGVDGFCTDRIDLIGPDFT